MTTERVAVHPDQNPALIREPVNPAKHPDDSDAEGADGWSTEQDDGSFTPVQVPAGWVPNEQAPSA